MNILITESQLKYLISEISMPEINNKCKDVNLKPTEAQKKAGNYSMGHFWIKGMPISIENPKGSKRAYKDKNGKEKYNILKNHYGYFTNTTGNGKDGDAVDVFIGPNPEGFEYVYVVDQNTKDGNFDESKVMIGFDSKKEAKKAYLSNYSKNWKGFRTITGVSLRLFKKWLYRGNKQRKPFSDYVEIQKKKINEDKNMKKSPTVFILVGLPGSGKSTWCKTNHPDLPIVSRDIIRAKLGFTKNEDEKAKLEPWQEEKVTQMEYSKIRKNLESGIDFIIDDTNLRSKFREKLIEYIRKYDVHIVGVVFNTPLETCINRRKGQISGDILSKMQNSMNPLKNNEVDDIIQIS